MAQRGGTTEQHAEAGRAGGEATAASHGRDFYEEIGRKGGLARSGNAEASAAHHEAAGHHDAAAHHHRQAAFHYSQGEDEMAEQHSMRGHEHSQAAQAHATKARSHSTGTGQRGGTSEQHARAGSQSHKNVN
jgi:general stress protein YciG